MLELLQKVIDPKPRAEVLMAPQQGLLVHLFVQLKKLQGYVVQVQIRLRLLSVLSVAKFPLIIDVCLK